MPRRPQDPHRDQQVHAENVVRGAAPPSLPDDDDDSSVDALLDLWFGSLVNFSRAFDIRTKQLDVIRFEPSVSQKMVFDTVSTNLLTQFLKGRQMWVTTAVVIFILLECLKNPGLTCCVAAHDERSAMKISGFYRKMHAGNTALVRLMPTVNKGSQEIKFSNGSVIMFGTANSEFWRGFPAQIAHLTEAALYENLGKVLASLGQTVPTTGRIILESTANGENEYYSMWSDKLSRYKRVFLCWLSHPEYVSDEQLPENLTDFESDYIRKNELPLPRACWWVQKYRSLPMSERHLIMQEYPSHEMEAFRLSGDRFLVRTVPQPRLGKILANGIAIFEEYDPMCQYAAGGDSASGAAAGDFTTIVIGNVTKRRVVATLQVRMAAPEFKPVAFDFLAMYHQPIINTEVNSYGLEITDYLREAGTPICRRVVYTGTAAKYTDEHGFRTTATTRPVLYGAIFDGCIGVMPYFIPCARLAEEVNKLCYDKNRDPGAPKTGHDDLAVAFGLMVLAGEQALPAEKTADVEVVIKSVAEEEWDRYMEHGVDYAFGYLHNRKSDGDFFD